MRTWPELAHLLRSTRDARGMTLRELAPVLGLSYSGLGRLERAENEANLDLLVRWARELDLELDVVVRPANEGSEAMSEHHREAIAMAFKVLPSLGERDLRMLTTLMRSLSGA